MLPARTTSALSLPEVLIILILAFILASLLYPGFCTRSTPATRQLAACHVRNIVNACESFRQDYGRYPEVAGAKDPSHPFLSFGDRPSGHCQIDNSALFDVLRAIDRGPNARHALNPQQTKYFESGRADGGRSPRSGFTDGPEFPVALQGQFLDPWSRPYCVILETDSDATLDLSLFYSDLAGPNHAVHPGAACFSLGPDGHLGGPGYEGRLQSAPDQRPDDMVSWQ